MPILPAVTIELTRSYALSFVRVSLWLISQDFASHNSEKCPRLSPARPKHTESLSQSYVWCMIYREHIFEALLTTLLMVLQWLNISFYHIHCRYLETVGNLLIMVLLEFLMVSKSIFGLLLRWWMSFFGITQSRWYFILFVCTHQARCLRGICIFCVI